MNPETDKRGRSILLGVICHLLLLVLLFTLKASVPESWRGPVLVPVYAGGAPWGAGPPAVREIRENDEKLLLSVAVTSVVATLLVTCLGWKRHRWFGVGFAIPTLWAIIGLLN